MKKLFVFSIGVVLSGCSTTAHLIFKDYNKKVTVESISKYENVHELVNKSSNFRGPYTYKTHEVKDQWITREIEIPVDTLKLYCKSIDGGTFNSFNDSTAANIYDRQKGLYTCTKNSKVIWGAEVKVPKLNIIPSGNFATADMLIYTLTASQYQSIMNSKREYRLAAEQAKANQRAEQARRAAIIASRKKPSQKDIGRSICKDTIINIPNNIKVFGQQQYEKFEGVVVGNLESMPTNSKELKLSIRGVQQNDGSVKAIPEAHFQNISLEAGRTIWDNKSGWYLCN